MANIEVDALLGAHVDRPADPETEIHRLMTTYRDDLYSFALAMTGDHDAAADCAQHTFVRAYEHLRGGRVINRSWLYRVNRNSALDYLRHRGRFQGDADLDHLPAADTQPDDHTDRLRVALLRLAPDEREALYLASVDHFRAREIGAMLGISAEAVRMRLYRAREKLRVLYGEPR